MIDTGRLRRRARALNGVDPRRALQYWIRVLANQPLDVEASHDAGVLALEIGQQEYGETLLRQALSLERQYPRVGAPLLRHLASTGHFNEAKRLARDIVRKWPSHPDAWSMYIELHDTTNILTKNSRIFHLLERTRAGKNPLFMVNLLITAGRLDDAHERLRSLSSHSLWGRQATTLLVASYLSVGKVKAAIEVMRQALHDQPGSEADPIKDELIRTLAFLKDNQIGVSDAILGDYIAAVDRQAKTQRRCKPKRGVVLHLVNSLAPGGTERQCVAVATAQARRGSPINEVWVIRSLAGIQRKRADFFLADLESGGVRTRTLSSYLQSVESVGVGLPVLDDCNGPLRAAMEVDEVSNIVLAIRQIRPSVVQTWTPTLSANAALAVRITGIPRLLIRVGSVPPPDRLPESDASQEKTRRAHTLIAQAMNQKNVSFVANSQINLNSWIKWLGLRSQVAQEKTSVLRNLVDVRPSNGEPSLMRVADGHRSSGVARDTRTIGMIARLEPEKDIELWYNVAKALCARRSDIEFLLAGEGSLRGPIETRLQRSNFAGKARMIGLLKEDLSEFLALCSVVILTSKFEGVPNVLLEAQWHGVPVIAPDVGGVREALLPGKTGLLVDRNPQAFADAIESLLDRPDLRTKMAKAAKIFVRGHFETNAVLSHLDELYRPASPPRRIVIQKRA